MINNILHSNFSVSENFHPFFWYSIHISLAHAQPYLDTVRYNWTVYVATQSFWLFPARKHWQIYLDTKWLYEAKKSKVLTN